MVKSTVALLCKSTSNLKKRKIDETPDQYLKKITHLYLNGKHLDEVGSELALCKQLNVLYLYDNMLKEFPDLAVLTQLTHLYLQNNQITRIDNLGSLVRLEKLFLSRNCISLVEGLEGLTALQELRLDNQRLYPGESLLFDEQSVNSIAETLIRLDVSGNALETLEDLTPLKKLVYLSAGNNHIKSMTKLSEVLPSWPALTHLELQGNPVMKKLRARDAIVVNTKSLEMLDNKPIPETTRQFLKNWNNVKGIRLDTSEIPTNPTVSSTSNGMTSYIVESTSSYPNSLESHEVKRLLDSGFESPQGELPGRTVASANKGGTATPSKRVPIGLPPSATEHILPLDRGEVRS
ncbi:hypothetical protein CRM22_002240 [Opisthorchis felineus]|uniref:Protein phosphatase 1 regulatory subunit 42 n=1 Tax=Opisthorchis felineus TaxID=147828 RepID=A0A4S2MCZ6_OPIFE|nr:hypothetical protein CRM22_002240 [Opisthorchis felineus]TGZ72198.1 hypothetical protein CRM22_002240 [Opisthorchis felineus]